MVGDDDEAGVGSDASRVECVLVRRVDLVEATDVPPHTRAGGRITHRP